MERARVDQHDHMVMVGSWTMQGDDKSYAMESLNGGSYLMHMVSSWHELEPAENSERECRQRSSPRDLMELKAVKLPVVDLGQHGLQLRINTAGT